MNLQEFINYRPLCPMCNNSLSIGFVSKRKQKIRYEDDNMAVYFSLDALNGGKKNYKVSYSFGLKNQSMFVDFYDEHGDKYYDVSYRFLIDRFKNLHSNLKVYKFYRGCTICFQYSYYSQNFNIDLSKATYEDLQIWSEDLTITKKDHTGSGNDLNYKLTNIYGENRSFLHYWKSDWTFFDFNHLPPSSADYLSLPIIPLNMSFDMNDFKSKMLEKISTIITFS